ncbi:Clp protease N-terminal domain-containing protein [Pseudonocardia spinosispora]|uniref:Clp protease N-terminal domain-containing protein n=1 Tax=Pseudonocardia spinosispora TaxID=103441 RepID=UPI00055A7E03|nr:Clp protease N-terminal domain-containing protein [Pseudonocardia spinosispora]
MDVNTTRINGWVTPRLEQILRRAAEVSRQHGYDYLAVEHVAIAMIEEGESLPIRCWDAPMTPGQWREAILAGLPETPTSEHTPTKPVGIDTHR